MKNQPTSIPYRPSQWLFWKAYWIHMRPYLLFISGIAGFSGIIIAKNAMPFSWDILLVFLAFFLSYGFGQSFTDAFQIDTDSLSAAYRPLSQKLIRPEDVKIISLIGLTICVSIFAYYNIYNLLFGILSIMGLASYSYFKKNYWYLGPYLNAFIVAILPLMGYHCFTTGIQLPGDLLLIAFINFFAYANFVIIGYLKDISADRATGYQTIPVVWGWRTTLWFGNVHLALILAFFILFRYATLLAQWPAILLFFLAGIVAINGQIVGHYVEPKSEVNAKVPIVSTVRSFLLWNGCIISMVQPVLFIPFLVFYLFFEFTLYHRPLGHQI